MDFRSFQRPDTLLRPAPFWSINDRLDPAETARQMADMRSVGLGGAFFHSRAGLETDYLSPEWFAAMDAALEVAKTHDAYLWLYDEDRWPSGNAGGQVAAANEEFRATYLRADLTGPDGALPDVAESAMVAAYRIEREGMTLTACEQVTPPLLGERGPGGEGTVTPPLLGERGPGGEGFLVIRRVRDGKGGWWSGESYANLLNPEAVDLFIKLTHDVYAEHYREEFGKRIPGIFTDEPQIRCGGNGISWWDGLPAKYAEWTKRDWWADLPYLYFDGPEARAIRIHIHRTVSRQFQEAYSKPLYEWCERNNLEHTGHYMCEDSVLSQIQWNAGPVMPHYRYMHVPGVDHLCRTTQPMLLTHKQASSAARQLGRRTVLTEIFGVSRHTNTFEQFKWIGNFNLVLGATFFCPHLTLYSTTGRSKRDYPPNWNYQQTYWRDLNPLNDYFTRLGYMLTAGEPQVDILVLHNIESATAGHHLPVHGVPPHVAGQTPGRGGVWVAPPRPANEGTAEAERCDRTLRTTVDAIMNAGYDCDLGDETLLAEMGSVGSSELPYDPVQGRKGRVCLGNMAYRVVVVPEARSCRPTTLALLEKFVAAGGTLVFTGDLPKEMDGVATDAWTKLAEKAMCVPCSRAQIQAAIDKCGPWRYSLRDAEGRPAARTYLQFRQRGPERWWFIVNDDPDHAQSYVLRQHNDQLAWSSIWNPVDGTRQDAAVEVVGDEVVYAFTLPPAGSLVFAHGLDVVGEELNPEQPARPAGGGIAPLANAYAHRRSEPNVLVMDRISASVDGGQTWWPEDLEFRVRQRLAEHFDTADALVWQPWVVERKGLAAGKGGPAILRYRFNSQVERPKSYAVVEHLTAGRIVVNGREIDHTGCGWLWDHDFGLVEITDLVQVGENVVDFHVDVDYRFEAEAAYIVGDFGVRLVDNRRGEIVPEPETLANGSWVEQGYPFYSGAMTYRTTFTTEPDKRAFLRLLDASGTLFRVRVNGQPAGEILWRPHALELTDCLVPGENVLEIDVVSSRQNTFGPLHEKDGDDNRWVGPPAFESEGNIREPLSLYDYGLLGGAEIVWVEAVSSRQ